MMLTVLAPRCPCPGAPSPVGVPSSTSAYAARKQYVILRTVGHHARSHIPTAGEARDAIPLLLPNEAPPICGSPLEDLALRRHGLVVLGTRVRRGGEQ